MMIKLKSWAPRKVYHFDNHRLYDIFGVSIETVHWAFGIRIADYTEPEDTERFYGFRLMFWKWHFLWRFVTKQRAH